MAVNVNNSMLTLLRMCNVEHIINIHRYTMLMMKVLLIFQHIRVQISCLEA